MLVVFQMLSGLFLLWYLILPIQNVALILQLTGGAVGIWVLFAIYFRSRKLFSGSVFFFFCLLLSFHVRVSASAGWMIPWYLLFLFTQWSIVLWFIRRGEILEASLFVTIVLVSPFYWPILDVRNPTFVGFSFWVLVLIHSVWILWKESPIAIPGRVQLLLIASVLPIPFALYSWRAIQFFLIQAACLLLYCAIPFFKERKIRPLISGYLFLSISIVLYLLFNDLATIKQLRFQTLAIRHHVLEHANTLAPLYIIFSSVLLYLLSEARAQITRFILVAAFVMIAILEFLTYSRNGWIAYLLFFSTYAILFTLRKREARAVILRRAGLGLLAVLIALTLLTPVRSMIFQRLSDDVSTSARVYSWNLGWKMFKENPLVGIGWFNYYSHARGEPDRPLSNLEIASTMQVVHNHSVFLDLAEAGGLPLVGAFIVVLIAHFRFPARRNTALVAGLVGVTFNNILDTASLWLTVYPHFWILLALLRPDVPAMIQKRSPVLKASWISLSLVLYIGGGILWLVEDHFLKKAEFLHVSNRDREAIGALKVAEWSAPFDVIPRERLLEIHLSRNDATTSTALLNRLMELKQNYAPYRSQLARIFLATNQYSAAQDQLIKAQQLDPYAVLPGSTYAVLAALQKGQGSAAYESNLYRYLTIRIHSYDFTVRDLVDTISEQQFLKQALVYIDQNTDSTSDRSFAVWHLYENLRNLNRSDLAAKVLRSVLARPNDLPSDTINDYCIALAQYYSGRGDAAAIEHVIPYVSPTGFAIVRAYQELARSDFLKAKMYLDQASRLNSFVDIPEEWEIYFKRAGNEEGLRTHLRILQRIPRQDLPPRFQEELAKSFLRERNYEQAAAAFRKLSVYDYSNPAPHWWEARMLWNSGHAKAAAKANERLLRLIPSNVITENLYRSRIEATHISEVTIMRVPLPNQLGGMNWRMALYAHPDFRLTLPDGIFLRILSGEAALSSNAWKESQDGFIFSIQNPAAKNLFSRRVHPLLNPQDRRWVAFEWKGQSQQLILVTEAGATAEYDWAFLALKQAN